MGQPDDLAHGANHGVMGFSGNQCAGIGGLIRHTGLVYTDIQHEFAPQAVQNVIFNGVGNPGPVEEGGHGFQTVVLFR